MEYVDSDQRRGDVTVTSMMMPPPMMSRDSRDSHYRQQGEDMLPGEADGGGRHFDPSIIQTAKRARMESESAAYGVSPRRPVIFHGEPVWNQSADESVFEEEISVGSGLSIPREVREQALDEADSKAIGRWGEQLVYSHYLQKSKAENSPIVSVEWMNDANEIGLPYDLKVTMTTEPGLSEGAGLVDGDDVSHLRTVFIEVKATLADKKAFFEISHPQLKFAEEKEMDFHIMRVYNVGKVDCVKIVSLENLIQKIKGKQVKVCMVI